MDDIKLRVLEAYTGPGPARIVAAGTGVPGEVRIIAAAEAPGEAERQERIDWLHRRLLRLRTERDEEAAAAWESRPTDVSA